MGIASRRRRWIGPVATVLAALLMAVAPPALAWGPPGHQTVAAIAAKLIEGQPAAAHVKELLGNLNLTDAAVWADCVKDVDAHTFKYQPKRSRPECAPFETKAGKKQMEDFVRRNATNCHPRKGEETCHKQYHYADIAIQHDHYDPKLRGARTDDVVASIHAAVAVLQGRPAPAPYSLKDKREALLVLVHYLGDIHQPLHVGAVYLRASGERVDPDAATFDPETETRGGNLITVPSSNPHADDSNLHSTWDAIPHGCDKEKMDAAWLADARAVAATKGDLAAWPETWASDTQKQAQKAFESLTFGPKRGETWTTTLPAPYPTTMAAIKKPQLTKAGARLAQLLMAIWPANGAGHGGAGGTHSTPGAASAPVAP